MGQTFSLSRTGKPKVKFAGKLLSTTQSNDNQSLSLSISFYQTEAESDSKRYAGQIVCFVAARGSHQVLYSAVVFGGKGDFASVMESWWLPKPVLSLLKSWHENPEKTEQQIREIYLKTLSRAYDDAGDVFVETIA